MKIRTRAFLALWLISFLIAGTVAFIFVALNIASAMDAERQRIRGGAVVGATARIGIVRRRTARGDHRDHYEDELLHIEVHPLTTPAAPLPPELPAE